MILIQRRRLALFLEFRDGGRIAVDLHLAHQVGRGNRALDDGLGDRDDDVLRAAVRVGDGDRDRQVEDEIGGLLEPHVDDAAAEQSWR